MSQCNNNELSLKEVYQIFCQHWNEGNRIWVHTANNHNYNIKLSLNDFLHFTRIDKVIKLNHVGFNRKTQYIKNRIMKEKLTFESIEQSLINSNQHTHFNLKKQAVIALALSIRAKNKLFSKICLTANHMFISVNPDFTLVNEAGQDRYMVLCNYINTGKDIYLDNLSYPKSLMYCLHSHARFNEFNKYTAIAIEQATFVRTKRND